MQKKIIRLSFSAALALLTVSFFFLRNGQRSPVAAPAGPGNPSAGNDHASFRILLGLTDQEDTKWDGSLSVSPGTIARLEPWRFDGEDHLEGNTGWKISTHPARAFGQGQGRVVVANGVVVTFSGLAPESRVRVETAQGNFQFRPADLDYGASARLLGGRAMVDRVPPTEQITNTAGQDHDYPAAAADREGNIWVAYERFSPNPKFLGIRMATQERVQNLAELAEPPGGDQIFLVRYSQGAWAEPIAISDPHGDLYRPAVALDGAGRAWVFWSANRDGNFDLYARSVVGTQPGQVLRLSTDRGPDFAPAAATDSQGRVWVAWQAFREGKGQIHAARQEGTTFTPEMVVASSASDEWDPAIAASPSGGVAVAWDSYRKGDFDVYYRTIDPGGNLGPEVAVAVTRRYEAYPSIAYDSEGRLWTAWEESEENWGKDWGAHETTGVAIYQGRWIEVKAWQNGQAFAAGHLAQVLPGVPSPRVDSTARQSDPAQGSFPDAELWKHRRPNMASQPPPRPLNNYPRLLADRGGRIWLAYRTAQPTWWSHLGTAWFENVVSFDGKDWSLPIFLMHSDNLLDNRPALVSTAAGELRVINSSDQRQQFAPILRGGERPVMELRAAEERKVEEGRYHNQLYLSRIQVAQPVQAAQLRPAPPEPPSAPGQPAAAGQPAVAGSTELADVRRLRDYRARISGVEYRIVRGEFHRHTDISPDGGRDGSMFDAWRYSLDPAALNWIGCCDHDNGMGREYSWWTNQKLDDIFLLAGRFTPMFSYERSIPYPEGHRNVIFAQRGVRTLPRLPRVQESTPGNAPDTQMLYGYLRHFDGIVGSHTSATGMGTDWRDNDTLREPVVEIYQGLRQNYEMPEGPRANREGDSIGGYRPKGYVSLALQKGYVMSFEASSDHVSTHISYCNLYTTGTSREALLDAFKRRHVYAATDNILADVRSGDHMMGDVFETSELPTLNVKLIGTVPFAKVHVIKDSTYVYTTEPNKAEVEFTWRDLAAQSGKRSYYYVRGEQQDGQIVWASPLWITYQGKSP